MPIDATTRLHRDGPRAACPAPTCSRHGAGAVPLAARRESPRIDIQALAYSDEEATTLRIPLDRLHWQASSGTGGDHSAVGGFDPPTELLETLAVICAGEIARRAEARGVER